MSSPRLRRLQADQERVEKEFSGHPHILVTTEDAYPPEVYHITYRLPGICLQGDTPVETNEHRVVFYLGADYPRLKPMCKIQTPIFHPNFRDGEVCIADYWTAAGETLVDLIVKVGDMIQYKIYNLKSPMDARAATWASENEDRFPVSNIALYRGEVSDHAPGVEEDDWDIEFHVPAASDTFVSAASAAGTPPAAPREQAPAPGAPGSGMPSGDFPHFDFSDEELDQVKKPLVLDPAALDMGLPAAGGAGYPRAPAYPTVRDGAKLAAGSKLDQAVPTQVWQMVVAGLLGALVAWVFYEVAIGEEGYLVANVILDMALWGAILAAIIGFFFGTVQDLLNRHSGRALQSGLLWMLGAAGGGFMGGALGTIAYNILGGGSMEITFGTQVLARTLAWGLIGGGFGVGQGVVTRNAKRLVNGLLGGLIGGIIGGFLFDFIGIILEAETAAVSRLVGFGALGVMIGLMMGLVEHLRREVWFRVIAGPMQGKQFILFGDKTTFGSSGKADIILYGDPRVPPLAFEVTRTQEHQFSVNSLSSHAPILHNDREKTGCRLAPNDYIQSGQHRLQFQERAKRR